ncbi:MAG: tetratricopeptide repeat protein [Chitinophagales bacterium]|nr:tetratricopeptide repeat protein [Chitinophagales bacterium]
MYSRLSYILILFFSSAVLTSCSSGKKTGQSYIGRVYHNTTAHYNGYYYGKQKMLEYENQMLASRKEDYSKLLPIYLIGNPEDAAAGSDMDSLIKRLTIVAKLHPQSKWTDDAYYNIGKAYYYKKNYEASLATFQFVSSEFKNKKSSTAASATAKKKKHHKPMSRAEREKEDAKAEAKAEDQGSSVLGFLKHKPIRNNDLLWLVRTFANLKNFSDAQAIIAYLKDGKFPKDMRVDLALTEAYVFIQQKQFVKAIEPMKQAVNLIKSKKEATRYSYILAQLYQLNGNYNYATQEFTAVTKMRPSYEMDFNARISVGKNYIQSGTGSPKEILSQLDEMSRNDTYEEFNDQIYYYMALVNLKQNKVEEAVKNLETSIQKSVANINQKGLSYLKIGELNFEDQDYVSAQPGYDSAVAFLDPKFDTLDRVKEIKTVLDKVVFETNIILHQDSLQKLARMSEKERNKIINNALAEIEKKQQSAQQDTFLSLQTQQAQDLPGNQASSSGNWYFYNTSTKGTGYNDFIKKWGNRTLEDNWRRSNKKSSAGDIEASNSDSGQPGSENAETSSQSASREAMLENIPLTPEKMAASNQLMFNAYYSLGTIYKDALHNIPRAIETFEKLAARFPDNESLPQVYYNLYLLHEERGATAKAQDYKDRILTNYAASDFAKVLADPEFIHNSEKKTNELDIYYASTYDYFVAEQYSNVISRIHSADSLFKPNALQGKFELLQAMIEGKTNGRQSYINALDSIMKKFPSGEVHDKAVEILTELGVQVASTTTKDSEASKKGESTNKTTPYTMHPNNPQYFVVVFNTVSPKTKAISDSLANFNSISHSLDKLKVSPQLLDTKTQMIVVKQMKNTEVAMNYYYEILDSETLFEQVEDIGYDVFIIDDKNFPLFYQRKNVAEYLEFFSKNYEGEESGNIEGNEE